MSLRPLKPCSDCGGSGYRVVKSEELTEEEQDRYNQAGLRWVRIPCRKCRGAGFTRD